MSCVGGGCVGELLEMLGRFAKVADVCVTWFCFAPFSRQFMTARRAGK